MFGLFTISVLVKVVASFELFTKISVQEILLTSFFLNADVVGLEKDPRSAYIGPVCYREGENFLSSLANIKK